MSGSIGGDQGEEEVGGFYDGPLLHEQPHDVDGAAAAQPHNKKAAQDGFNPNPS